MKDIMGLMGQMKDMQARMEAMQAELSELMAEGRAGGGLVTVTVTAKGELRDVSIDPSLLKEDEGEILEDLLVAAHADAKVKADRLVQEKTQELTAGLPLPPGMKLPF